VLEDRELVGLSPTSFNTRVTNTGSISAPATPTGPVIAARISIAHQAR
jgi:hypothetical protein